MSETFDLEAGYYVVAYEVGSTKAVNLSAWLEEQGANVLRIASDGTEHARAASISVTADTTYPIGDYPLLFETTATGAEDPIDVYLATPNSQSVQARVLVSMQASDSRLAIEAAIASGKLAIATSETVVGDLESRSGSMWSRIPWWVKVGALGIGGLAIYKGVKSWVE